MAKENDKEKQQETGGFPTEKDIVDLEICALKEQLDESRAELQALKESNERLKKKLDIALKALNP